MGNALTRPDCQLQRSLQVEEGYGPILNLCANNAFRLEPKAVPIKPERVLQIINADGDDSDSWLHTDPNPISLLCSSDRMQRGAGRARPPASQNFRLGFI